MNKDDQKKIKWYDAHSHLHSDFFRSKEDSDDVAEEMLQKGIHTTVIGVDLEDSKKAYAMALKYENIVCSIGIHPTENVVFEEKLFQDLLEKDQKRAKEENKSAKIVCVGECGLDYYWPAQKYKEGLKKEIKKRYSDQNISKKEIRRIWEGEFQETYKDVMKEEVQRQEKIFKKQIDFAEKNNLPLMLHVRSFEKSDAHRNVFRILDAKNKQYEKEGKNPIRADFHFFTEGPEIVEEIVKRGYMISLPGVITFADLDSSIAKIPIENILSETDSPFAAPIPHRGKTNTPLYIPEIVEKIAKVKNLSVEEVRMHTVKNVKSFFGL